MAMSGVGVTDAMLGALANGAGDELGLSVLKKGMDIQKAAMTTLLDSLPRSANPSVGKTLDVRL